MTQPFGWYWCLAGCNRCGNWQSDCTSAGHACWPAADGNYYGRLCRECVALLGARRAAPEPDPLELARFAADGNPHCWEESA